ncbi:hypothetical protein F7725_010671 [Dissostichus mawsoni]|uniref:Uncharacterized protein n=1 Tax=Dissostichus mawsoni TaxID=36200 RepID=A0A7J5XPY9_DISMA|nr:hypothetical protein F7725_010671 [Dissostichus mawsoni]
MLPIMPPSGNNNSLFPDLNLNEQEWTELMEELNCSDSRTVSPHLRSSSSSSGLLLLTPQTPRSPPLLPPLPPPLWPLLFLLLLLDSTTLPPPPKICPRRSSFSNSRRSSNAPSFTDKYSTNSLKRGPNSTTRGPMFTRSSGPRWPPPSQSPLGVRFGLDKPSSPSLYQQDFNPGAQKQLLMPPQQPNKGPQKARVHVGAPDPQHDGAPGVGVSPRTSCSSRGSGDGGHDQNSYAAPPPAPGKQPRHVDVGVPPGNHGNTGAYLSSQVALKQQQHQQILEQQKQQYLQRQLLMAEQRAVAALLRRAASTLPGGLVLSPGSSLHPLAGPLVPLSGLLLPLLPGTALGLPVEGLLALVLQPLQRRGVVAALAAVVMLPEVLDPPAEPLHHRAVSRDRRGMSLSPPPPVIDSTDGQ